jgi:anti-anti-sigma factor
VWECVIERSDALIVVTPAGDMDLAAAPSIRDILRAAVAAGVERIDVDMGNVTFLDSSAIGVLVAAHRAAADRGIRLRLRRPGPVVRMVLEITNLAGLLVDDTELDSAGPRSDVP